MRTELAAIPAIQVGGVETVPSRLTWALYLTPGERAALGRAAEILAEERSRFPLDDEAHRVLAWAVEAVQLVVEEEG